LYNARFRRTGEPYLDGRGITMGERVTRGRGLLEPFLARQRAREANRLVPRGLRTGRILDIGCGTFPYFLSHTSFREKFAIDRHEAPPHLPDVSWFQLDLNSAPKVPFEDGFFSAVTLLAVVEHLNPGSLVELFKECRRALAPGGVLILTTPAAWSAGLLRWMARSGLVSKEEIDEHVFAYTLPLLGWYFGSAGFEMTKVHFGYFELGLNLWATATR
jgi:SAM-dependent methyltransferase